MRACRCMHGAPALTWSDALAASAYEFFKGTSMATARHADSYSLTDAQGGAAGETLRSHRCCNALSCVCNVVCCVAARFIVLQARTLRWGRRPLVLLRRYTHARATHAHTHTHTHTHARAHTHIGEDVVRRGGEMRAVPRLRIGQERVGRAFHRDDLEGDDGHGLRKVNQRTGQSRGNDVV